MTKSTIYWQEQNPNQGRTPTLPIIPAKYDIVLFKGNTFPAVFTHYELDPVTGVRLSTPLDLTTYTASMSLDELVAGVLTNRDTLTSGNGRLVMGGVSGTVRPLISAAQCAAYGWTEVQWKYALIDAAGVTRHALAGVFTLPATLETRAGG